MRRLLVRSGVISDANRLEDCVRVSAFNAASSTHGPQHWRACAGQFIHAGPGVGNEPAKRLLGSISPGCSGFRPTVGNKQVMNDHQDGNATKAVDDADLETGGADLLVHDQSSSRWR